jgi:hypothetical protein
MKWRGVKLRHGLAKGSNELLISSQRKISLLFFFFFFKKKKREREREKQSKNDRKTHPRDII